MTPWSAPNLSWNRFPDSAVTSSTRSASSPSPSPRVSPSFPRSRNSNLPLSSNSRRSSAWLPLLPLITSLKIKSDRTSTCHLTSWFLSSRRAGRTSRLSTSRPPCPRLTESSDERHMDQWTHEWFHKLSSSRCSSVCDNRKSEKYC